MTLPRELLNAVLAQPADDTVRLVVADWLEETGEPGNVARAKYIRHAINKPHKLAHLFPPDAGATSFMVVKGNIADGFVHAAPIPGVSFGVSRGFVSEVHTTLARWVGEECDRCGRVELLGIEHSPIPDLVPAAHNVTYSYIQRPVAPECPHCHGSGRLPGVGARIVAEHPVERVVVKDREPLGSDLFWWTWDDNAGLIFDLDRARLPRDLMVHLSENGGATMYPTRDAAFSALSAACIAFARREAVRLGLVGAGVWPELAGANR